MPPADVSEKLASALQLLNANRINEAEALLRQVLAAQPSNHDALAALAQVSFMKGQGAEAVELLRTATSIKPSSIEYRANLGMVLSSLGRLEEAIEVLKSLVALRPDLAEVWNNLGVALRQKNRLAESEAAFRTAVQKSPNYSDAVSNLGVALEEQGKLDEAVEAFESAARLAPQSSKYFNNLATALLKKERSADSEQAYRKALEHDPRNIAARFGLGCALHQQGKVKEAVEEYRAALTHAPNWAELHFNLARAAHDLGEREQAEVEYRRAIELNPQNIDAVNNLGVILRDLDRPVEAEKVLRDAIRLQPKMARLWNNLGGALNEQERWNEGIEAFGKALEIESGHLEAEWNRGSTLLSVGRLAEGWPGYETRKKLRKVSQVGPFPEPQWQGEDLGGKKILLYAEQGFGDTIQFIRYAPGVIERGGRVIVICPRAVHRLLSGKLGIEQLVSGGDPMPTFDVQCALPSLPGVFGTTLETVPWNGPYLAADEIAARSWGERVAHEPGRLKVGLVWAGNPEHSNDRHRSIELAKLGGLAGGGDITFFSLQKGPGAQQSQSPPAGMRLVDWTGELTDFAETAALIENLDLVIAVDTAVVHLAGAMGKPVWVMLPRRGDWRWIWGRSDSPWYPSARLFRQERRGEWGAVFDKIVASLRTFPVSE